MSPEEELALFPRFPPTLESPDAVVYFEYALPSSSTSPPLDPDASAAPELPPCKEGWTRFVCVSDTHGRTFPVPDGDVLLHSGDMTSTGTFKDFKLTTDWLCALPHKRKIIIAGNHDLTLHRGWYEQNFDRWHRFGMEDYDKIIDLLRGKKAEDAGLVYLEDAQHEFRVRDGGRTWTVWGSPWSPEFCAWAFGYERGEDAQELVNQIPQTDILLTHGPPAGILDVTYAGTRVGCEALTTRLAAGALRPRLHLFGHIHEAHGVDIREWPKPGEHEDGEVEGEGAGAEGRTVFVNAANWPMGPRARDPDREERIMFAGAPFQPVVVDLKDDA